MPKWQEQYDFYLKRPVFELEGRPTEVQLLDSRNLRWRRLCAQYDQYFAGGNLDYIGHCFSVSKDKYWENRNDSFEQYMKLTYPNWLKEKVDSWRMIPPSLNNSYKSFSKYDRPQYVFDVPSMRMAGEWTKRHFAFALLGSKVLSFNSVISELDLSTSSGFPWNKMWPTKRLLPDGVLGDVCERYWDSLALPYEDFGSCGYVPIWTVSQKRELRTAEKILDGKVRTFTAAPFEQTVCMNRLCLDFNNRFYRSNMQHWSFVGCSKFMGGWDMLYRKLSVHPNAFELDESNYDCSLLAYLMYGQADIRWEMMAQCDKTSANQARLYHLYDQAIHSFVVMEDGLLLQKHTGNPSGSSNTIVDNTMILFRLFAYAWIQATKGTKYCTYQMFMQHVSAVLNGDDNTFTVSDECVSLFNPIVIKRIWDSIGVTTKTPSFEPRPLHEVEFLSQRFVKYSHLGEVTTPDKPGIWCPAPDRDRVLCSLMWASKKDDVRWHYLRACALKLDCWADKECRDILDGYIEYLANSMWSSQLVGVIDDMPIQDILGLYRGDKWCWALYSGQEGVSAVMTDFPFTKFSDTYRDNFSFESFVDIAPIA